MGFQLRTGIFVVGRLAPARLAPVAVAAVRGGRALARLAIKGFCFGWRRRRILAWRLGGASAGAAVELRAPSDSRRSE